MEISTLQGFLVEAACEMLSVARYAYYKWASEKLSHRAVKTNLEVHPLFYSDKGFQYTNRVFHHKLIQAGMTQSMSRCIKSGRQHLAAGWKKFIFFHCPLDGEIIRIYYKCKCQGIYS